MGFCLLFLIQKLKSYKTRNQAVTRAMTTLTDVDERIVDAVDARQELDLRIGASFTRLQTLYLQKKFPTELGNNLISYG